MGKKFRGCDNGDSDGDVVIKVSAIEGGGNRRNGVNSDMGNDLEVIETSFAKYNGVSESEPAPEKGEKCSFEKKGIVAAVVAVDVAAIKAY